MASSRNAKCHVAGKPGSARAIARRKVSLSGQGHPEAGRLNYSACVACNSGELIPGVHVVIDRGAAAALFAR